jgi:anti-anti-sigma factor
VAGASCPDLAVTTEHHNGRTLLRLLGELDAGNWDCLRQAINGAMEPHPQTLVIDLSEVGFADCGGLAVLVWAHQHLAEHGRQLIIAGSQPAVRRLLCLTGLDTYLHLGGHLGGDGA